MKKVKTCPFDQIAINMKKNINNKILIGHKFRKNKLNTRRSFMTGVLGQHLSLVTIYPVVWEASHVKWFLARTGGLSVNLTQVKKPSILA